MLGNFSYCNPTRIHFGKDALEHLREELAKYEKMCSLLTAAVPSRDRDCMTR